MLRPSLDSFFFLVGVSLRLVLFLFVCSFVSYKMYIGIDIFSFLSLLLL